MNLMPTLHGRFDAAAVRNPEQAIAFPSENERTTYGQLRDTSRRMAATLLAAGARPGGVIGVLTPNSVAFLQGVLAAWRIGAAACPLPLPMGLRDLDGYLRRAQRIVDVAAMTHLVTVPKLHPLAEQLTGPLVLDAATAAGHERLGPESAACPGDLAVLQFTSGSTAEPKGVQLTHANVLSCTESITSAIDITGADSWGSWLPLFHDMGLFGTITGLFNGIPVNVWSPMSFVKNPADWLTELLHTGATICAMPNFGYDYLVSAVSADRVRELDMSHWRVAFNGAESISVRSVRDFLAHFAPAGFRAEAMTPAYGMAEATLVATLPPLGRPPVYQWVDRAALSTEAKVVQMGEGDAGARGVVGLGQAVPGMRVRVGHPERDEVLADREVGEIQVAGSAVTTGYLGRPDGPFTADGWLRTGDLGYLDDGELYFTGRSKEMITVRGENIYPLDVEAIARQYPDVYKGRCVAFALTDDVGHEQIVLCAETRLKDSKERDRLAKDIASRCTAELGLSQLTVQLVTPSTIPRTTSGKLQRLGMRDKMMTEAQQ